MIRACLRLIAALFLLESAGSAAGQSPPVLRLDDTARPVRYAARLRIVPTEPTFTGSIDIDFTLNRPTNLLWLNGRQLSVRVAAFEVNGQRIAARAVAGGEEFLGFRAGQTLPAGAAKLHVEYTGQLSRKDDRGLFAQKENERWYAITQFEPIFARRVFPCFDEPGYKTPWQLTIEAPASDVVLSNTAAQSETREHPGTKTIRFQPTRPLPSYLIAFAVGPYDLVELGGVGTNRVPLRIAAPLGRGKDTRYAAQVTGTLVEHLERYFGSPFPFDKLDLVTIPLPTQFGAMENPGLITFSQNLLVARPEDVSVEFQRGYAATAAHELAHQWFGDYVTAAWWDDIWLNESFASWMEDKIIDAWHPDWTHHAGLVGARSLAMSHDGLRSTRKIRQTIDSVDDIYNAFDSITYSKGQAVLGMFENFVGPETFQRGIRQYIKDHADGNATADDFVAAIAQAAGRDLGLAWRSFLDQAGAPLVSIGLSCAGRPSLMVSQTRYLPIGSKGQSSEAWQVPLCASFQASSKVDRICTLITTKEATVPLGAAQCPTWVLANSGELGYYRVAYQGDLLQRLFRSTAALSLPELVGLLDDVGALAGNGTLPLGEALALVPALADDPRREVVQRALSFASDLREHIVTDALRPNYGRFVQKLFAKRAHALGWSTKTSDDEDTRLLRSRLLFLVATEGMEPALRTEALELVHRWLADKRAVDGDVIGAALATAARTGDRALFSRLQKEARRSKERRDRQRLLVALGQFADPALAREAAQMALSDEFDPRESISIVWAQIEWPTTRPVAWEFVKRNFEALARRLPAELMASLPWVPASFCDQAHGAEMSAFFRDRSPKLPGGPRELLQATEAIGLCDAYVQAQQPSALKFLERY